MMFKQILIAVALNGTLSLAATEETMNYAQQTAYAAEFRSLQNSLAKESGWRSALSVLATAEADFSPIISMWKTVALDDQDAFRSSIATQLPTDVQNYMFSLMSLTSSIKHRITAAPGALTTSAVLSPETTSAASTATSTGGGEKVGKLGGVAIFGVVGAGVALL